MRRQTQFPSELTKLGSFILRTDWRTTRINYHISLLHTESFDAAISQSCMSPLFKLTGSRQLEL
jgi:hypothetical protein